MYLQGEYVFNDSTSAKSSLDAVKQKYEEQEKFYEDLQIQRDGHIIKIFLEGLASL